VAISRLLTIDHANAVCCRLSLFNSRYRLAVPRDFAGQVTVERMGGDTAAETVTAPGLWELMYFGKTSG
jgi:hypothetical protein